MEQYIVVMKREDGNWTNSIGVNEPRSYQECQDDIKGLESLGGEWEGEYDIIEVNEQGQPVGRLQLVD